MLIAYDSVLAPASNHGIASTPADGSSRGKVTAASPSRRVAAIRSATGFTVTKAVGAEPRSRPRL